MPHPSLAPLITLSAISSGAAPILADVLMSELWFNEQDLNDLITASPSIIEI